MEALIVGAIILGIFFYNNTIDKKKFLIDNEKYLQVLREDDYTFLVYAKYGEDADADQLYLKRATYAVVTGSVAITNEGNLIEGKDVIRVLQKAVKSKKSEELEYISMMPTSFSLDDDRIVKDPKGLTSKTLAVRGVMVSTPKKNIYPILACLERLGVDVLDITLSSIGDYFEFKNKELDKNIGVVVNMGDKTTTMSVFNKGVLTNTSVVLLGGQNIDNDISFIYKLGFAKFVEMLKTNKMPLSFDDLVKPVYILNAIQKSLDEDREVQISEVM